jgi:hypothetical protein
MWRDTNPSLCSDLTRPGLKAAAEGGSCRVLKRLHRHLWAAAKAQRVPAGRSLPEREEFESEVPASSGDCNVVAAADCPGLDDLGVDPDIRLITLRCGTQDAGIFG